ncbi:uncharacterized protein EI90DRAFT_3279024 [Cantharellus anzutake]|uniref:uncharacterized protein n=1 Tax=Cantharellus anzutake TaxID=1750568 RepID=UPI00190540A8|nr:uncharacterized protein EI90DRAFT_3279024 [Cantharellus anzutake]KAF8341630.1 hypothetical protein EI90DRAFT_3279024 [Cantharellus anzutake]
MPRSYLRHGETKAFGLVCSPSSNAIYDGKLAYAPALEDVLVWDVKKGQMIGMWHETGHRSEVTCMLQSPRKNVFAIGYADGSIRLWDSSTSTVIVTLNGHKRSITALAFDGTGARLASGSQDTDLIIWDVLAETGLYRLRGHRDQITAIKFLDLTSNAASTSTLSSSGYVLTSSKDTYVKLWDLSTQHCIQTVVGHRSEVWSLALDAGNDLILTGGGDGELKAWRLDHEALQAGLKASETGELPKMITPISTLPLAARHRVSQIVFHPTQPLLAVQSHERSVQIFHILGEEEAQKKQDKRKKAKRKGKKDDSNEMEVDEESTTVSLKDLFTPYLVVKSDAKIRSLCFPDTASAKSEVQLFIALTSNTLQVFDIPSPKSTRQRNTRPEATRTFSLDLPGHRTDIRSLSLSSDDQVLASASDGLLKIWNLRTTACIRTMECGYAVCSAFLPGNRQIVVGTKSGELQIFDVASSTMIASIKAHEGTVFSMHVRPDEQALVTGSADKDVKFWEFEPLEGTNQLSLVHVKTLKMTDDVLAVKYSPDGRLLAVALLDSTVKVFYQDTLKFFLSLYGHKLPVLSLDISTDSKLIVTCSADKNVKIWGLDFGDCHKSIFAHQDSIMQVAFERDIDWSNGDKGHSHYFWTVSKDKMVKYWDGDKFENIQKFNGHHGEIWALVVSGAGKFVVTGSHDKSIRVWEKTDDLLFLEEEREKELEALYEGNMVDAMNRTDAPIGSGVEGAPQQLTAEAGAVSKQTLDTLMAGERIVEALEVADTERHAFAEYEEKKASMMDPGSLPPPAKHPVLAALSQSPEQHVFGTLEKIPSATLFDALLVLPFTKVISLFEYLNEAALRNWNIVLVSRIMFFLLKTHHHQVVATNAMRVTLVQLRKRLRSAIQSQKTQIGYNLAGLQYLRRNHEAKVTAEFWEAGIDDEEEIRKKLASMERKRKRINVRA